MSWIQEFHTENEEGRSEVWKVFYRRLSGQHMLELDDILDSGKNKIEMTIDCAHHVIRRIEIDGKPYTDEIINLPFDMVDKVLGEHTTFRDWHIPKGDSPEGTGAGSS